MRRTVARNVTIHASRPMPALEEESVESDFVLACMVCVLFISTESPEGNLRQ